MRHGVKSLRESWCARSARRDERGPPKAMAVAPLFAPEIGRTPFRVARKMATLRVAAGLGTSFQALFQANRYVVAGTFDPKYESSYLDQICTRTDRRARSPGDRGGNGEQWDNDNGRTRQACIGHSRRFFSRLDIPGHQSVDNCRRIACTRRNDRHHRHPGTGHKGTRQRGNRPQSAQARGKSHEPPATDRHRGRSGTVEPEDRSITGRADAARRNRGCTVPTDRKQAAKAGANTGPGAAPAAQNPKSSQ